MIRVWGALEGCRRRVGMGPQATSLHWQEASKCLSKSKELMETVLRDPGLLGLQREGGATLARLRQEASRLDFNPDVRYEQPGFSSPSFVHWPGSWERIGWSLRMPSMGAFAGSVSWAEALVRSLLCCPSFSPGHLQPKVGIRGQPLLVSSHPQALSLTF